MGWLFVPGLEGLSSGSGLPSDPPTGQFVTSKGKPLRRGSWRLACSTAAWPRLLSGMTSEHSTAGRGVAAWISSLPDSPASLTASRAPGPVQLTIAGCGLQFTGSSKPFSPESCSSKTSGGCSRRATAKPSARSSRIWPAWGSWEPGGASRLPTPELRTAEIACSSLGVVPTPSASCAGYSVGGQAGRAGPRRPSLETMAREGLWPTPRAADARTPGVSTRRQGSGTLTEAVRLWPTPMASDSKRIGDQRPEDPRHGQRGLPAAVHRAGGTGKLNPQWVEWLMGFPPGWTDCALSGTG